MGMSIARWWRRRRAVRHAQRLDRRTIEAALDLAPLPPGPYRVDFPTKPNGMPIPAFVLVASDGQQIPLPTHSAFAAVATEFGPDPAIRYVEPWLPFPDYVPMQVWDSAHKDFC
jgi:hypothetical protein